MDLLFQEVDIRNNAGIKCDALNSLQHHHSESALCDEF